MNWRDAAKDIPIDNDDILMVDIDGVFWLGYRHNDCFFSGLFKPDDIAYWVYTKNIDLPTTPPIGENFNVR